MTSKNAPDTTNEATKSKSKPGGDEFSTAAVASTDGGETVPERYTSHFCNEKHPIYVRWGILVFLIGTFVLLVCADVGSGVTAESILMQDGEIEEIIPILTVSILNSVGKLWEAESYPLAIFIAITSIGWPYIKLFLATMAWVMPYKKPYRRELLIVIIDFLGKWSFVDIMVLVEIMVAFRSSLELAPGLSMEVIIAAQWGFYGFVIATMLSLSSTHIILYYHRQVHCHRTAVETVGADNIESGDAVPSGAEQRSGEKCGMKAIGGLSTGYTTAAIGSLVVSMAFYLAGVLTKTFEVTSTRGEVVDTTSYSINSIGLAIPEAYIDSGHSGTRFIQFMWFFLGIATPLLCSALLVILFAVPSLSKAWMRVLLPMAEIAFAWSCAEVLFVSTIMAVQQMPVFGDGLVESNCVACFLVTTKIYPEFALLCIGTVLNVGVNLWLLRKADGVIFHQK